MKGKKLIEWNSGHVLSVGGRVMWWAPWGLTEPFTPRVWRGGDEFENPSACVTVPLLGAFILFYSRHLSDTPVSASA